MSESVSIKSCENFRNVKKNLAEKNNDMNCFVFYNRKHLFARFLPSPSKFHCQTIKASPNYSYNIIRSTYYLFTHWLRAYS